MVRKIQDDRRKSLNYNFIFSLKFRVYVSNNIATSFFFIN